MTNVAQNAKLISFIAHVLRLFRKQFKLPGAGACSKGTCEVAFKKQRRISELSV
jgi:hypothetical protein